MVERQLRRRGIEDERVLAAMAEVPRERFVPEDLRRDAYRDGALRIGEGQTISQPWIVACMASLLELEGDERVLEVGTGSGYAAAVLSRLCAEVVTIERYESLAEGAPDEDVLIRATQAEIAHLAGTSRESASRFLATLEREGVVKLGRGKVTVREPGRLRNYIH